MALTQKERTELHQRLVPVFGDDASEHLMALIPASEQDQLVTRKDLLVVEANLRAEIKSTANKTMVVLVGTVVPALIGGMAVAAAIG